jgi:hypothetical protein
VHDSPEAELSSHFDACFAFISEALAAGGGVLVHCFAGRSRSVTVLLAFLMRQQHLTLQVRPVTRHAHAPLPPRSRAAPRAFRRRWPWCMPCGPSHALIKASCGS